MSNQVPFGSTFSQFTKLERESNIQDDFEKRIREAQKNIPVLIEQQRFFQALKSIQSIEYQIQNHYKIDSNAFLEMHQIRSINKIKKKCQLILLHNRALVHQRNGQYQRALQLLVIIIDELQNMIQSQQSRYGYLQKCDQNQRRALMGNMRIWKKQISWYYYLAGKLSYMSNHRQIAIASLQKSLKEIIDLYQKQIIHLTRLSQLASKNQQRQEPTLALQELDQIHDLCLIDEMREKLSFSKYLNIVTANSLLDEVNKLINVGIKSLSNQDFTILIEKYLFLDFKIDDSQISEFLDEASLTQLKAIQFLNYDMLAQLQIVHRDQVAQDFKKLKSTKNVLLLHMLELFLYQNFLPNLEITNYRFKILMDLYNSQPKFQNKSTLNSILALFGLNKQKIKESTSNIEGYSLIEAIKQPQESDIFVPPIKKKSPRPRIGSKTKLNSPNYILQEFSRSKDKSKQIKSKSKSKSKSKGKPFNTNKSIKTKRNSNKVKDQYMINNRSKPTIQRRDHLLIAIQEERKKSASLSARKARISPKKNLKTQANIQEVLSKQKKSVKKVVYNKIKK